MRLAVVQMSMDITESVNLAAAEDWVRQAAAQGAQVVLLPELFAGPYFPQQEREEAFDLAQPVQGHPFLPRFQALAAELKLVLPISFFERAGQAHYNSLAMVGVDGAIAQIYRKSHIPDGPCYEEKYYFNPGDSGFQTYDTGRGTLGAGICWDQWFPEAARCMALRGAEVLLYPTAIGSEPPEAGGLDSQPLWRRAMVGHAVSNSCYLAAANRVGQEAAMTFYGSSFICDYTGEIIASANRNEETLLFADLDLATARKFRAGMGFFRDRRPDLYGPLLTLDGHTTLDQGKKI
jgi:N-carbamoylputrescine amidase